MTLRKLLEKEQTQEAINTKERDEWVSGVWDLFKTIQGHLETYEKEGLISTKYQNTRINEKPFGKFDAPVLIVTANGQEVHFTPVSLRNNGQIQVSNNGYLWIMERAKVQYSYIKGDQSLVVAKKNTETVLEDLLKER